MFETKSEEKNIKLPKLLAPFPFSTWKRLGRGKLTFLGENYQLESYVLGRPQVAESVADLLLCMHELQELEVPPEEELKLQHIIKI